MSESLKIKWPAKVAIPLYEPRFGEGIEVIPADLGRDLHNACVGLLLSVEGNWPEAEGAVARYEREVGS